MGYESWSPELQGSAQSRPIPLGPEHAGTMVPSLNKIMTENSVTCPNMGNYFAFFQ